RRPGRPARPREDRPARRRDVARAAEDRRRRCARARLAGADDADAARASRCRARRGRRTPLTGMTPEQYVQQKAAASGSSFYYAFLFLAPPRRAAITAFYAFCREVDDIADDVADPGVAATKLAWWRSEVASTFAGHPSHPAMQALLPHVQAYAIEPAHLLAVIEGCQMDLEQTRYLDFAGLARYCDLVAGVVGEVAANIFGRTLASTVDYAHRLGLAMQLTNIVRDVGDDARRGRIYLPVDELQRFDVKAAEILERRYSDRFTALMR